MTAMTAPRPSLPYGALRVFDLTLGQMLWSRRTVFMAVIVGVPVLIAGGLRALAGLEWMQVAGARTGDGLPLTGPGIFGLMVWVFYLRFIVPVLGVSYGTSLIADEVEDRTVTYLFTRPIPRGAVLLGKYLAFLVSAMAVVLPSVLVTFFLVVPILGGRVGESFPALVTDLGLIGLGLAVYGAVFALVGAWFRRPLLAGLVFAFGWEPVASVIPGYMKYLTVSFYLQGLVPHAMPRGSVTTVVATVLQTFQTPISAWSSLGWLGVIWVGALVAAVRVVETREYVLEQ